MKYLVKMTPLEPYAFGTEQGFAYPGEESLGKSSYFVRSGLLPEQTTIWGMLRFWMLSNSGLMHSNFQYSKEEQERISLEIGSESFQFQAKEVQNFGKLKAISPLFLLNKKDEILIKNPYHNKSTKAYEPMEMSGEEIITSAGTILLPKGKSEYDAKAGYAQGYINLNTKETDTNLFEVHLLSGNRKNNKGDSEEDCYFKREVVTIKKGYSFAVYMEAEAENLPESGIVYMGQKQSMFKLTVIPTKVPSLKEQVEAAFAACEGAAWMYALSDLYVGDKAFTLDTFSIVEEKYVRNLETVYQEEKQLKKVKKSKVRYNLIKSGSVFYEHCPLDLENRNVAQLGYNQIVQLGGKR